MNTASFDEEISSSIFRSLFRVHFVFCSYCCVSFFFYVYYRNPGYVPESEVGFSARVSNHATSLKANQRIIFGTLVSNIGNYYSNQTGIFYAPVDGTYMFYVNILSEAGHFIETELVANSTFQLAELYSGGGKFHGAGSNLVVVHLAQGDQVWVRVHVAFSSDMAVHCCWSTFSGYLLREGIIAGPGTIVG